MRHAYQSKPRTSSSSSSSSSSSMVDNPSCAKSQWQPNLCSQMQWTRMGVQARAQERHVSCDIFNVKLCNITLAVPVATFSRPVCLACHGTWVTIVVYVLNKPAFKPAGGSRVTLQVRSHCMKLMQDIHREQSPHTCNYAHSDSKMKKLEPLIMCSGACMRHKLGEKQRHFETHI